MKERALFWGVGVVVAALSLLAYVAGAAQAKPAAALSGGDALRWHIVTNPGDSSKTFLIDSLVGESYIFSSSGDTFSWKKMEKTK